MKYLRLTKSPCCGCWIEVRGRTSQVVWTSIVALRAWLIFLGRGLFFFLGFLFLSFAGY